MVINGNVLSWFEVDSKINIFLLDDQNKNYLNIPKKVLQKISPRIITTYVISF